MADEPVDTSLCYDPTLAYKPPVGRLPILGKMRAEVDQLRAAQAYQLAQIANELAKTINDTTRATNDTNKNNAEMAALVLKNAAEVALLNQKTETELAQVADAVPSANPVTGIIGKQKALFQKQTDGFDRDAEQKLAKIMTDTWITRQTTDGASPDLAGLSEADIASVLTIAKAGIAPTP